MNGEQEQQITKKQRKELRRQERRDETESIRRKSRMTKMYVWSGIGIAVIAAVWFVFQAQGGGTTTVAPDNDPFVGGANASVVVTEYSDFQCPACKAAQPVVKQVIDAYGDKIKFVYSNFPLSIHQNSQQSARAGECAFDQGKFWEYHDKLFDEQENWSNLSDPKETFVGYARDLGLNEATFISCYDGTDAKNRVEHDLQEGNAAHINSTPTFVINGQKISGAQPFDKFKSIIDAELAKAQK